MKWTTVIAAAAKRGTAVQQRASSSYRDNLTSNNTKKRSVKALALSVYFKHSEFGMKDYEILSRASAFLLGVDVPDPEKRDGPYGHLQVAEHERNMKRNRREQKHSPASGPPRQSFMDFGWLEFIPREVRPQVHVVASSHVLSPFLWRDYYPQDWLSHVRQEHCTYSLEVYDPEQPEEALCKLDLNSQPFHHPEGMDIALIHFREEEESLKVLKSLGVELLRLRDPDKLYQKGEEMIFEGYVVSERNPADSDEFGKPPEMTEEEKREKEIANEDLRIFYPHTVTGKLSFHTNDRFFAQTPDPLQEGFCGAPVVDKDGDLCGTVLGIVPTHHKDERLAGSAAFMPSHVMRAFVDYVERWMVEKMMPKDLFSMVKSAKETNSIGGGVFKKNRSGDVESVDWEEAFDITLADLKKRYSKEEVDEILENVRRQRDEVMETFNREGGDLDEIVERVGQKSIELRELVHDQIRKDQTSVNEEQKKS